MSEVAVRDREDRIVFEVRATETVEEDDAGKKIRAGGGAKKKE